MMNRFEMNNLKGIKLSNAIPVVLAWGTFCESLLAWKKINLIVYKTKVKEKTRVI